ncbi:MAG: hypothetical protein GY794_20550 [bacterium]|nr:hypothetical protein [bacterium]
MTDITLEKLLEQQKVETADSQLVIQMPDQKLAVGQHRFNLTVEDDSGNASTAAQITVLVVDTTAPTAVLDLHDERGRTVTDGRISFGSGFILSGKRSVDIGGTVARYRWEVVVP